jgi:serine/threonine-protein kinase
VQPRNVLIDRRNNVKIIDFGLAQRVEGQPDPAVGRGGVSFFFEPEFARASLDGVRNAPATEPGEQYALAAMLYLLVTGSHYLDFSLEKFTMLRQIAEAPMLPFARANLDATPELEAVLRRALSKLPGERFTAVREFARAWSAVIAPSNAAALSESSDGALSLILSEIVAAGAVTGRLLSDAPMAAPATSLTYGSAGLACVLYHIACASDDGELFATADAWSQRAVREIAREGAFFNDDLGVTPERVGSASLHHGPAGVYALQALIAGARGDFETRAAAIRSFIECSCTQCDVLDLTLGYAGALLGCAILVDAANEPQMSAAVAPANQSLHVLGDDLLRRLQRHIRDEAPIGESNDVTMLGIAHGWAGLLYAAACWSTVARKTLSPCFKARLAELAGLAEPIGRGLHWKMAIAPHRTDARYYAGWCNGTAGYIFLWTLAYRITGEAGYLELAKGAAWNVWENVTPNPSLCCGAAGQSYALLNLYRSCGDTVWLERARYVAQHAAREASASAAGAEAESPEFRRTSLYKGVAGLAMLAADLNHPELARMPTFELES